MAKTGLKAFEPTYFTVDCAEAGQGKTKSIIIEDVLDNSNYEVFGFDRRFF